MCAYVYVCMGYTAKKETITDLTRLISTRALTPFDLANCRQRNVAVEVVPQAIIFSVHVDAMLYAIPVVWLVASPVRVRQRRAPRLGRFKRSL